MHNPLEQSNSPTPPCGDRLRRLPTQMLPPYNWQEFQLRSQQRAAVSKNGLDWRHMAAAAALLLIVCGIAVWGRVGSSGRHVVTGSGISAQGAADRIASAGGPAGDVDAVRELPSAGGDAHSSRAGIEAQTREAALRSRQIESWLATLPREPVVVRVGTRAAVARLEDRIAQVDDLLTSVRLDGMPPDRLAVLQQERVRLVGSLAQVRYAEVVASESP
jgi:hypothetical protein